MWNKVALKYCGGCDPEYDRKSAVAELKSQLNNQVEWVALDSGQAEAVIVIQGCPRACADLSELPDVPQIVINNREQAQKLGELWSKPRSVPDRS